MVVTLRSGKELIESERLKIFVQSSNAPTRNSVTTPTMDDATPILKDKGKSLGIGTTPEKTDFPLLFPNEGKKKVSFHHTLIAPPFTPKVKPTTTEVSLDQAPKKAIVAPIPPYVPFPQRLRNQKEELQFKKFLDVFKQLHIDIPLVEAIEQMPSYAKFLKDILSKKKKLREYETCPPFKQITPKLKDLGSFTIPCLIGGKEIGKALCDLGANINHMSLSVFNNLGIGEARPTTLADKSISHPKGKIEDVLIQVNKFIFPADFIILDFDADKDIPIILGRPFLATGRTLIDVQKGELTMRVHEQNVTFNVFSSMRYPEEREECSALSGIKTMLKLNKIEVYEGREFGEESKIDMLQHITTFELLESENKGTQITSIESPPDLELKQLPSHLKYAFLGEEGKIVCHYFIYPRNTSGRKACKYMHTKAIGWTISDLKEDKKFTSIEPQRRLNPIMKEVVKKEILKWLDVGIIYPIASSSWVSPIQCIPKRICMDYCRLNKATKKTIFLYPS
ncbi:LOW QUALITY PROTEIN: hypothetical protein OSB04_031657 [Centaurea solstitialis]|uniref:Uncharacterized protein n=1 Tax=Centaurea solstitialis TaxID=347529 RepID=A0AA38W677_9ASTR|nr:LOW QUALITY PROTEIN: hypothetical protein OSB04_031657 [Centaurea solstitialis]